MATLGRSAPPQALDAQLLLDDTAQLGVQHRQLILARVLLQELLKPLAQLAVNQGCSGSQSLCRVLELAERLQLHYLKGGLESLSTTNIKIVCL